MLKRVLTYLGASAAAAGCLAAPAAAATPGPPPPPTAANGHNVQTVGTGLSTPVAFAFGAGKIFVASGPSEGPGAPPNPPGVFVLIKGQPQRLPGSPDASFGVAWHKGTLYASGGVLDPKTHQPKAWHLYTWSGWDGTKFASHKVIYTAPKGFPGFNGIAFGRDGRLYTGVDVGNGDHAPATKKTPYLYDILSFNANGRGLKVVATGLRQPWQLAFTHGSSAPYVTDFGQDAGAKNPPDLLVHVRSGDQYGFPQCNWTKASLCKGFTKPFKLFAPHTDNGGIAIAGGKIYLGQFGFAGTPQVVWMPLKGGALKPFLTGFNKVPVFGVGISHGWLYVGTGAGFVYRVHL